MILTLIINLYESLFSEIFYLLLIILIYLKGLLKPLKGFLNCCATVPNTRIIFNVNLSFRETSFSPVWNKKETPLLLRISLLMKKFYKSIEERKMIFSSGLKIWLFPPYSTERKQYLRCFLIITERACFFITWNLFF